MIPDYVHLLVSIPPKTNISGFMGYLKGKSAMMIFDGHSDLKYNFGSRHFWPEGYYVSTVTLNEETIAKYIREQEKNDQILDNELLNLYVVKDEWVCSTDCQFNMFSASLYKIKVDGSTKTFLTDDSCYNINFSDDFICYSNSKQVKVYTG
ncbi:transposase-like protein [Clostridiales bacterium oral taxon 876 str. F0540]|nr:transposase-like protein [Clostridiales bacterium oral taxon 876 str. F0540]